MGGWNVSNPSKISPFGGHLGKWCVFNVKLFSLMQNASISPGAVFGLKGECFKNKNFRPPPCCFKEVIDVNFGRNPIDFGQNLKRNRRHGHHCSLNQLFQTISKTFGL